NQGWRSSRPARSTAAFGRAPARSRSRAITRNRALGPSRSFVHPRRLFHDKPPLGRSHAEISRKSANSRWRSREIVVLTSLSFRNEPGNAGLHNGIEPDPRLDSFADLPHGVLRNGGDVKVLLDPAGGLRGGQEGR